MNKLFTILLFFSFSQLKAQSWAGTYQGIINGDQVVMTLHQETPQTLTGSMKDSQQSYAITAEVNGNRFAGDAKESSLGLTFGILGEHQGSSLHCNLLIEYLGKTTETKFIVTKIDANTSAFYSAPSNTTRDQRVAGKWTKSENYNSGYGGNFMGSSFSQSIIFMDNGGVANGGNSAAMSGSNYFGQSSGNRNVQSEPGLTWFTKDNHIWLTYTTNGQTRNEDLGKYYIEGSNMLITGNNGVKMLLQR